MTPTEVEQLYEKEVEDQDGEPCQLRTICLLWVPVEEKGEHFRRNTCDK